MDARAFTGGVYLRQEDISGSQLVTIARVGEATFEEDGKQRKKLVVFFEEHESGLAVNATNCRRIMRACDAWDTDQWIGHKVILFVDEEVEFGGRVVGGLRVRKPVEKELEANEAAPF